MRGRAPGKVVLSGAYAVLSGAPALVSSVTRYVEADSAGTSDLAAAELEDDTPENALKTFLIALAARDSMLFAPGRQVVQVEMSPVLAFGKPDHFVGGGHVPPIHRAISGFKEGRDLLFENVADITAFRVGDAKVLLLVIAGS